MNSHFSLVDIVTQADPVVKSVFILLGVASVWCWAIILRSLIGLIYLKRVILRGLCGADDPLMKSIVDLGAHAAANRYPEETAQDLRQRVTSTMRRHAQEALETRQKGLTNLAVISSVAPFVGLFGTVWGIMSSFISIAASKDTSLAVVAPGIAEALAATAVGLAAAIPAAFAYNRLAASFNITGRRLIRLAGDQIETSAPYIFRVGGDT